MGQLEDLQAALTDITGKVDLVGTEVGTVATEVKTLIEGLSNHPAAPDLSAAIAAAQNIAGRLDTVAAALKAIPPAPTA